MENRAIGNAAAAFLAACVATAGPLSANTVTFDALPDYDTVLGSGGTGSPYVENGVTVTATTPGGVLASYFTPGTAHLDDSGTDMTSGLMFTMGRAFNAVSFSLISLGYDFMEIPGPLTDNIFVTGIAGGSTVASASYTLSDLFLDVQTITLGSAFSALDALLIEIAYPRNEAMCGAPCGHFDLDEVVLTATTPAPVPLPPAAPMMAAAGLALFALGRRRAR